MSKKLLSNDRNGSRASPSAIDGGRSISAIPPRSDRAAWRCNMSRTATSRHTRGGDGTAVRLSAPGAVLHDVAHQVAHVVLQIPDDVLDDVSDRDHAHDLARVQHWQMAKTAPSHHCHAALQPIVRLHCHRVARHHLAHWRLLRIEPEQQHFDSAVTLGHDT